MFQRKLKKGIAIGLILLSLGIATKIYAAPVITYIRETQPETTDTYSLGASANRFLKFFTKFASTTALTVSGQSTGCAQFDSTGFLTSSGSSCGGTQQVATSTNETAGQLSYWTTNSGTPAKLGKVATTSLTATSPLSLSQAISVIGASASAMSCNTASGSQAGCLSSTDWNTFNNKVSSQWTTNGTSIYYNTGNVGIGTTTPFTMLGVAGTITANNINATSTTGTSTISGGIAGPSNFIVQSSSGRVGIGAALTTTLSRKLEVTGNAFFNPTGAAVTAEFGGMGATAQSGLTFVGDTDVLCPGGQTCYAFSILNNGSGTDVLYANRSGSLITSGFYGLSLGTVGTPMYSFLNDSNTGAWSSAADTYNISTGGKEKFRITNLGYVGIGTTTPYAKLSVAAASNDPAFIVSTSTPTATTTAFIVDTNGKVGIGSSTPGSQLDIAGSFLYTASSTGMNGLNITSGCYAINGTCLSSGGSGSGTVNSGTINQMAYYTGATAVSSSGFITNDNTNSRLGIGTTSPWANLSVGGGSGATTPLFAVASSSAAVSTSTAFIVDSLGNAGVGTTSPFATLAVNPIAGRASNQFVIGSSTATNLIVTNKGFTGLGTSSPGQRLGVTGNTFLDGQVAISANNTLNLNTTVSGSFTQTRAFKITDTATGRNMFQITPRRTNRDDIYLHTTGAGSGYTLFWADADENSSSGGRIDFYGTSIYFNPGYASNSTYFTGQFQLSRLGDVVDINNQFASTPITFETSTFPNGEGNNVAMAVTPYNGLRNTQRWRIFNQTNLGGSSYQGDQFTVFITEARTNPYSAAIGIGTSTPTSHLEILEDKASRVAFSITASSTQTADLTQWRNSANAVQTVVTKDGTLGVGTSSPWRKFSVDGTVSIKNLTTAAGALTGGSYLCLSSANEVIADSATCLVSSKRFKDNITKLDSSLDEVMKLKPVSFTYKPADNTPKDEQIGFIAEDVVKVEPRLVELDNTGLPFKVRYENMTALIVKAIQELNTRTVQTTRSVEENWQWLVMGLLSIGFIYQQVQIKKLKK